MKVGDLDGRVVLEGASTDVGGMTDKATGISSYMSLGMLALILRNREDDSGTTDNATRKK